MDETFGDRIRRARRKKDWMIKDLIEHVKRDGTQLTPSFMTRVEQYGEVPGPDLIIRMAEVLEIPPEELFRLAKVVRVKRIERNIEEVYRETLALYRKQGVRGEKKKKK